MVNESRRHPRFFHPAKIRVIIPTLSEIIFVEMRDFSESGLFLLCDDEHIPPIGAIIEVQTTEFEDAPIQMAKVVRVQAGVGFGVAFDTD